MKPNHHPIAHYSTPPHPIENQHIISFYIKISYSLLFILFYFLQCTTIFCIYPHYTLDLSNYFSLKLLWQGEGSIKWVYYEYEYCVCVKKYFSPQTNLHAHTQVYIEHWIDVITIYNRVSAHFCIYFYFFFNWNCYFSCFLYFIHNHLACISRK